MAARPNPWQWLRYAMGGGLPPALREWVLFDVTVRTWWLRQVVRSLLQMSPLVIAILVFVPGPFWIRGLSALGGTLMGLLYAVGYLVETTEHRLLKAGYPVGTGEAIRASRETKNRTEATARRREKFAARLERRAG